VGFLAEREVRLVDQRSARDEDGAGACDVVYTIEREMCPWAISKVFW
jgi:hypothetical protein